MTPAIVAFIFARGGSKGLPRKNLRLLAGKPLIVGKIGQTEPGSRAVASHTAALAGSTAAYRAIFDRYGLIEGRDFDEMLDLAMGFLACGDRPRQCHKAKSES